jgi:hypothetical protein
MIRRSVPAPVRWSGVPRPTTTATAVDGTDSFDVGAWVAGRLGCDPDSLTAGESGRQGRDHSEARRYWLGSVAAATVTLSANRRNLSGDVRRLLVLISPQGSDYRALEPETAVVW